MVKLYGFWMSPFMSLVADVLRGADIEFEYHRVSTLVRENDADAYRAISTFGKVPALVDSDGTAVVESSAICRYLARRYPAAQPVYPCNDAQLCARVDAASDFLSTHVSGPYFNWFVVCGHFPIAWDLDTAAESNTFGQWSTFLVGGELGRLLDQQPLTPYFTGNRPRLPDYQLFYLLEHGRVLSDLYALPQLNLLHGREDLQHFYTVMAARPTTTWVLEQRENEHEQNAHELLAGMKPAHADMLRHARVMLAELFGHDV